MGESVQGLLRDAGWRPGRSEDVSAVRSLLESKGYDISKPVELFIREFNGITIDFVRNGRPDSVWFDVLRASALADPEWVEHYGERTRRSLVPVGFSNHEHLMLMQSDEGSFYGAFDDFLCTLGSAVEEMIENLVNQDREPLL
jgi:hypothetical protein